MSEQKLRWKALSFLMRTVGKTSQGISLGYSHGFDSGTMLDYVYENKANGAWPVGPLIDRVYLNAIGWRGIRARKEVLKTVLEEELTARCSGGRSAVLLDVASGPGRYLLELVQVLRNNGSYKGVTVICRDLDPRGLELGQRRAQSLGIHGVRWEHGNACNAVSLATVKPRPDVVVASGLYELLDEDLIRASMKGIAAILRPGGRLVFTTQVHHPQLEMIANVLVNRNGDPWVMTCRSTETTEGWARDAGFKVLGSRLEPCGLFAVTVAETP